MSKRIDSRSIISDYIFYSKYSRVKENGHKESWEESVDRVMDMHLNYLLPKVKGDVNTFNDLWFEAKDAYSRKEILGAQRALQYGGSQLLQHQTRLYNCCSSYIDRIDFFEECMYLLLSGCGTGYSVQKQHIENLPIVEGIEKCNDVQTYIIADSIEGWAYSVGKLIKSYFFGESRVKFDYSLIREEGAYISGGFSAPGPDPLRICHEKLRKILDKVQGRKLTSFEAHYITCVIADAVISGGIRRSAMICLFDIDDVEMMTCKTGDWFSTHKELCRCNNSVVILPNHTEEQWMSIMESIKAFGEPGIVFLEHPDYLVNPCAEVGMFPKFRWELEADEEYRSGWSFCNLSEINGALIKTPAQFYKAARTAAIIGTFQAVYTDFKVLSPISGQIARRDALIGVGITGMADNPDILFNPEYQRRAAEIVVETNKEVAALFGISPSARCTVVKPSGNSSQLLGCGSGIHSYHYRKYIRNIQASSNEQLIQEMERLNPDLVTTSYWNAEREKVISFPIELGDEALVRTEISTLKFLANIYRTQLNWIEHGTNFEHPSSVEHPSLRMNVSCTVSVHEHEWEPVFKWIWNHREGFCGLSFLPETGDLDYPQAPYTSYLDENELSQTYGKGAILSSGLIVDGLNIFKDIHTACEVGLNRASHLLELTDEQIWEYIQKHMKDGRFSAEIDGVIISDLNCVLDHLKNKREKRKDWKRRFIKFADNYFDGDINKCARCLKHVNIFHQWQRIKDIKIPDWQKIKWKQEIQVAGSQVGTACAGGSCEI